MAKELTSVRERIDELDRQIVGLLGERFKIIREAGEIKVDKNLKLFQKARVEQVLNNVQTHAKNNNLSEDRIRHIYTQLIDYAHEIEGHIKEDRY
jgi:chorismate mutase